MCEGFARLNEALFVVLKEIEVQCNLTDDEMQLRKDALISVTSNLMGAVFDDSGYTREEVFEILTMVSDENRKQFKKRIESINDVLQRPN